MAALLSQDGFWGFYFFKAHHINIFLMCYLTGETAHVFYFSFVFFKTFFFFRSNQLFDLDRPVRYYLFIL